MSIQTRKQREIARRERMIIDAARAILVDEGYYGLTMEKIALAVEYSRGTVYQHFATKDELVGAAGIDSQRVKLGILEKASTYTGKSRERICALIVGLEMYSRLYRGHFRCEEIVRLPVVRKRLTDAAKADMVAISLQVQRLFINIANEAASKGDLRMPPGGSAGKLYMGLWSICQTSHTYLASDPQHFKSAGIPDGYQLCRDNVGYFLDGYGWAPGSRDWNYGNVYQRIWESVFPEERERILRAS